MLSLHEEAARAFDGEAAALRTHVRVRTRVPAPKGTGWQPDLEAQPVDPSHIIGPIEVTHRGEDAEIIDLGDGVETGLTGPAAVQFDALCQKLWKALRPKDRVALESVAKAAREWLLRGKTTLGFSAHCLAAVGASVKRHVLWIPVAGLAVESRFQVADVAFEELSAYKIRGWHHSRGYDALSPEERRPVDAHFEDFARENQGYAVGGITVEADPALANHVALSRVESALGALRFFSPPARQFDLRSFMVPRGMETDARYVIVREHEHAFAGESSGLLYPGPRTWGLSTAELAQCRRFGLDHLSAMLASSTPTDFELQVIASTRLYGEASLEPRPEVRLLLMLTALEALLLKNAQEPIQQNLGERMAFLVDTTAPKRREVIDIVREAYAIRSSVVHHNKRVDDPDLLNRFSRIGFSALCTALAAREKFTTPQAFIDAIEELKLT